MADRSLLDAYLDRLDGSLPLADAERAAAIEEIAAHLADATAALVEHGVPYDVAERRALSRLGAPERLAEDLAAAHRRPRDLLVATDVALRWTVRTTVWSVLVTWIGVFVVGIAAALAWTLANRLVSLPPIGTSWLNAPLAATTMAIAAYAVGRAIIPPVAVAAHRSEGAVRTVVLALGLPVTAWIGLTWFSLAWNVVGVAIAALLPVWFALGVTRSHLVPRWFPLDRPRIGWALIAIILISVAGLSLAGAGASTTTVSEAPRQVDPAAEWAAIAPFPSWEAPAYELVSPETSDAPLDRGPGPLSWTETWRADRPAMLAAFSEVRIEAWAGRVNHGTPPINDAVFVNSRPLGARAEPVTASLELPVVPDRDVYYLALVGVHADGRRELLAWPTMRHWSWWGTPLDYLAAVIGR